MRRLVDCLGKTNKLINRADADALVYAARALEKGGLTPIEAERQAVRDAQEAAISNGENILRQIQGQRPQAYQQAADFWNRETLRKAVEAAPLPRFVTEGGVTEAPAAPVPVDQILAVHNAPDSTGSTVNAVHGDLGGTNSYSFSIFPDLTDTVPGKIITAEQVNKFAAKAQVAGIDVSSPNISIGTWYDRGTDTTFLDIAFTTTDRAEAIRLGDRFNQKAVFDLSVYQDIPLKGTGIAPENLPSIAERIGILFEPGYDVGRYAEPTTTQAQGAPSAPGAPASAQGAVARGAQGGQPEVGGVHEEVPPSERVAPPEIPAAPISDAAQEAVNSLPEEQRGAAQKAFARDDRDPLADDQRSKGQPVEKRRSAPVAPEKNKGLLAELSKYGVWDKPVTEVLKNIASDPKQPRWVRALTDLLVQLGLGEGVDIRVVNTPNAIWPALYDSNRKIVYINLSYKGDLARRLLHELLHHGTLNKLTNRESNLTPTELAAKRSLQDMFDIVRKRREFRGVYGASNLQEFVSEVFANDNFRRKLNSIRPDGKVSLLQRFADAVRDLLIGDLPMRRGSLLDAAIKEAINVAGSRAVETPTSAAVAAQEQGSLAARQANKHPNFQEQIAETIAPMADNMGISDNDLIERKLDHEAAFYAEDERKAVEDAVDERAKAINATPAEIAEVKKQIEDEVKYNRAYHPTKEGWANKAIKVLGLEDEKGLTRGDPTKQNPSGIAFKIKYKDTPYTYARDAEGKPIQRFLKQGKPDKETGKPIDNPEWGKRVGQLANKMFDDLQGIMARRGKGDDKARVAQVIVDQIEWYRSMRTRLRTEFGSMSDYVADVIAGFSPITDVPGNWNNFIEYFRHVMRGDYDEAFRKFDEYISADPKNRSSGTYKKEFPPKEFPDLWPRKLLKEGQPLFGANTGNALMAGLDLWRSVKSGTAPKARNFGLNLIGQSLKATIDRWAGRYLQRMHAPTWRLPPSIEGAVTGTHMPGENVDLVSGDFGMGQDVFEQVAKRLQESGHEVFKEVTPADLQAILWFAEKEVWEMRKWTDIMGAGSSMNVVAQATAAQRYEAGTMPSSVAQPITPAKLEREIQSDTGYVYHATNLENLHEIAESGKLQTHKPNYGTEQDAWPDGSTQKRAYFSGNAATTWSFAPEDGMPVVVRTRADPSLGTESSTGDIYSSKPVSASKLEYLGEDNQWHPLKNLRPPEAGKEVSAKDEKLMSETIELRTNLNAEAHMLGAKMAPSVNIADGKESKTFDGEWITEPEYNPENSIGHVARIAARLGKKAAHISRVIVNPYEVNDHITPGLHIFFKGRVGDAQIKGVLNKLKTAGITNGISLTVDPRVRPEIIKSLDPKMGANQYNGVRVQFIPEYGGGMTRDQIEQAFADVNDVLTKDASVAESRVLHYDTLVLKKGTDYDTRGKLTKDFSEGRAKAWTGRARNEGAAAAARRDDVIKAIADRKRQDLELESRMDREQQERIARYAESQRKGVGPPRTKIYDNAVVVAPMVETHHGTPHDWAAEKRVRFEDGTLRWVPMDEDVPPGATVIERAPAGRVRADKVLSGEGNIAYGWGVLYSAMRKSVAEWYRKELSGTKGEWFIDGKPIDYSEEATALREALISTDPEQTMDENITAYRDEVKYRRGLAEKAKAAPMMDSMVRKLKVKAHLEYADLYEQRADALEQYKDRLTYRKAEGNVYTVQLDVEDPELLDWFKPMKDQMHVFDKMAAHYGVTRESAMAAWEENERLAGEVEELSTKFASDLPSGMTRTANEQRQIAEHAEAEKRWEAHHKQPAVVLGGTLRRINSPTMNYTGEKFYRSIYEASNKPNSKRAASELLNSVGVPGIVFLDQESRKVINIFSATDQSGKAMWVVPVHGQPHGKYKFDTEAEAKAFAKTLQFNNYVIFDPEKIKVVAKNGEVVRTVADDLPAPTPEPVVEPVTVAAMSAEDVRDDRDLTVAPMAGTGRRARRNVSAANYKPAGSTWARLAAPFKGLSWEVGKFEQQKRQKQAATTYRIQTMVNDFQGTLKKVYKGKLSPQENKNIMLALGNLDNRLTQEQAQEAKKMTPTEREGFLHTAHMENVAQFKLRQEQALNSLPDEIREAVNKLREALDLEAGETLRDTGLNTELRARLDANQGVFLHSNAFQHFEDEAWGKHIKSDDPKAVQIRGAAENLFRNEIIGENALAYQKANPGTSDADALKFAAASGDLDQQVATRLDDYLKKDADEPSRLHMLMGKMPVTRTEAGKMLALDRENIPKEVRDLWGQYDDPVTNFAKTLSILANHNAQTRMQNAMLDDGLEKGYFWKQDESPGSRPSGLVQMSTDTRGPFVGVHGPPALKEALSLMNQRPVRSLMSELNSIPLVMKTVGSIASATRNLLGNPLFMVSNGNLPISAIYWPKAFWRTLQRAADRLVTHEGRKELTRMIELGVLDENVDSGILERIAKNARMGQKWESQKGFGASVAAVQRGFLKVAAPFQKVYVAADNFWRLANYNVELLRQKWMNPELSLEQQEENAAEITRKTLPTYSNIPEWFRESYGKGRDVVAPYLSFQAEAMRTYASSVYLAWKEVSSGKPKEMLSGSWRLLGLAAAAATPIALGMASKAMFGYDDDDEKAIRAGLPEYQRNNTLFFLPRGPNGEPRFFDIDFMNPYSLVHKAFTAAWRGAGALGAAKQLAKPIFTAQPVAQLGMDLWFNKDSRGGGPVYDEYDSPQKQGVSIAKRMFRDVVPGTATSLHNIAEAYFGRDLLGNRFEKTGEKRDLLEEVMKVFPGTAVTTFDRDKAMQAHVGEYKKAAGNASGLFDKKISAEGPIGEGEVGAAYKEADERSFRAFQEMRQAYKGLLKLGMKPEDAINQMRIGFGDEVRKGGLSKTILGQILGGNYRQFMPSGQLLKSAAFKQHHKRIAEFNEARRKQPLSRTASP